MKRDSEGELIYDAEHPWNEAWESDDRFRGWLRVDKRTGLVHCQYCEKAGENNDFNHGRPITDSWSAPQLTQHAHDKKGTCCKKHKRAKDLVMKHAAEATALKQSRRRKLSQLRDSILVVIRSVYWLCSENIAMLKIASLYTFIRSLPGMLKIESVDNMAYVNAARCREFVMSLSSVLKGYLWADILGNPYVSVLMFLCLYPTVARQRI